MIDTACDKTWHLASLRHSSLNAHNLSQLILPLVTVASTIPKGRPNEREEWPGLPEHAAVKRARPCRSIYFIFILNTSEQEKASRGKISYTLKPMY